MPHRTLARLRVAVAAVAIATGLALAGPVPRADAQRRGQGPRVIQLDEIRIEGRVQKPNAFYILNRSQLGYEVEDLRATFMVRNVLRSVETEPF